MAFLVQKHHYSITPSSRAEKHPNTCAERNTTRLPSRKTPKFLRRRCSKAVPGRKRYHFLRRTEYQPPPEQENTPFPAQKVPRRHLRQKKVSFPAQKIANTLHKSPQHHYFSVFGNFAFLKKNSQDKFTRSLH